MDSIIISSSQKEVARKLCVTKRALESRLGKVRLRMGVPLGDRIQYMLKWHDWRQGEGKGVPA